MVVFELDYGDLLRPEFRIVIGRGWGQCTNRTGECLIVYGPKHPDERSIFDTTPYMLPPGATTPDRWDCDGFLVPADRAIRSWRGKRGGPLAVKIWDFRHVTVKALAPGVYSCSW